MTAKVRPKFAPPVYQAWADARLATASGTTPLARFTVTHIYTQNGYLWKLADGANQNRVYWSIDQFFNGNDVYGDYYQNGMDARGNPVEVIAGGVTTRYSYDGNSGYLAAIKSTSGSITY